MHQTADLLYSILEILFVDHNPPTWIKKERVLDPPSDPGQRSQAPAPLAWQPRSGLKAKHRRMLRLQHFSIAQIHVYAAGQARIETSHRPHDVDPLEFIGTIFLEDRRVLHRILIRTRSAIYVTRIGVPGRRRIRMIVCDLALADHNVMRKNATHRLMESATNGLIRNLKLMPCFRVA